MPRESSSGNKCPYEARRDGPHRAVRRSLRVRFMPWGAVLTTRQTEVWGAGVCQAPKNFPDRKAHFL
jgi:hypothetical protein